MSKLNDLQRRRLIDKLNKETEDFINEKRKKNKNYKYEDGFTDENIDEILATHPAFINHQPTAEEIENNPLLQGLQQIQYDPDDSPYDKAISYKNDGNFQFKCKKYKQARAAYTEAIKAKCTDDELNAILYSNRAASNYHLENYRSSLLDSMQAVKFDPKRIKSLVRCAQCCEKLKRYDDAVDWCNLLISIDQDNVVAKEIMVSSKNKKKIEDRNRRKVALQKEKEIKKENLLLQAIEARKINFKSNDLQQDFDVEGKSVDTHLSHGLRKVYLDENQNLVWPVLLLYPEYKTTDFIEHFHENATFYDLLETVFLKPATWDMNSHYKISKLAVFYENVDCETLFQVPIQKTLGEILSHSSYIVQASTPNFYILSQESNFYKSFLKRWKTIKVC